MTFDEILPMFAGPDGTYHFARWRRPIAPVVFGVSDERLAWSRARLLRWRGWRATR